jgi:hypothetical protein
MKRNGKLWPLGRAWRLVAAVLLIAVGLAGCAGEVGLGGGGGISGTGVQTVATGTVTGFGSVIVGGVHYSAKPGATVQLEGVSVAERDLQPGMVVVLRGQFDSTANTGSYDSISYRADLKGPVAAVDVLNGTFTVFGQTVLADAATVFDGVTDLAALANGSLVQVSGAADTQGRLHATRVFRQGTAGAGDVVKIKGRVASVGSGTLTIGSQSVAYTGGTVFDNLTAADLSTADTRLIEVTGTLSGATINATRIERVDSVAGALTGERLYLRGFVVSGSQASFLLNTANGTVSVAGAGASFKNGSAAALVAGAEVEVTGTLLSGGAVQAAQIEFELDNNINIEGDLQAIDTAGKTLTLNGVTVTITDQTLFKDSSAAQLRGLNLANLAVGNHVRIGGNLDRSVTPARVLATKLERFAASAVAVVQGPVSQIAPQLAILGVPVTVSAGTQFRRQDGAGVADFASFSALLTLNSTVVKAKGSFVTGTGRLAADELDIE